MSLKTKDAKVEVRLTEQEKFDWKSQADAEGVSVSTLLRRRMRSTSEAPVDLDAEELSFLREDLTLLEDEQTPEDVASWKAFAADRDISFAELLQRVVLRVNRGHLA
jgi:hypothetical protein